MSEISDYSNAIINNYNESQHQLTNILVSASVAYMAIVTAILGPTGAIEKMSSEQLILTQLNLVSFLISIISGIVLSMHDFVMFRKMHLLLENFQSTKNENKQEKIKNKIFKLYDSNAKGLFDAITITIQVFSFTVGIIATVILIFSYF